MHDVTSDCHLQCTGQCLEDALNLVVLVLPLGTDVQVHAGSIAERLKEVQEHLRGHLANLLSLELCIPHEPGTSAEVECDTAEAVIHGQAVAIALNAAFAP